MKKILLLTYSLLICAVSFAQPVITTFSPTMDTIGSSVTITGTGFNTTANQNIVFFGATQAVVTAASADSLTVIVPLGATYQYISVTNLGNNLTAYSAKPFVVTFEGDVFFSAKIDSTTGTQPYSVSTGDIDGDGKPDLVVTNNFINTVSVFRSTSTSGIISFAAKVNFATGSGPSSVSIVDINGDGKPDLVVVNGGSNTVSVFRSTSSLGIISFAAKVNFATGSGPNSVVITDIDGDGKSDLAVTNYSSNRVSVFRNTSTSGTVSFATKVDFITSSGPVSVSVGDIDNDGKPDLSVANDNINTVSVFRNTSTLGTLSFANRVDFPTGSLPRSVKIGDIDGDGKLDLAVTNYNSNTVSVFRNTSTSGTVSFAAKVDFATGFNPYSVSIGDIDGDGILDLAVVNGGGNDVSVFRSTSSSGIVSFAAKVDFITGFNPYSVSIGDIDGDGKPDLAVANSGSNTVSILQQNPPPPAITSFTPSSGCPNTASVVITGTGFLGATAVRFGGINALIFTVNSATQITATVGNSTTGTIQVTTMYGTVVSAGTFTVYPQLSCANNAPLLNILSPPSTFTIHPKPTGSLDIDSDTSLNINVTGVGIMETLNNNSFSIYPNPFSTQTNLVSSHVLNNASFTVYNSLGQEVKQMENIAGQTIVFYREDLPNGIYFIHLTQNKELTAVKKLVIN